MKENKQGFLSNNFLIRIHNSIITAMNSVEYALPSAIVILIDNRYLKEEYFGDRHLAKLVESLLENIIHTVRKRKRQMNYPYWEENQPKIIFIRPIPRPAFSLVEPEKYKNIRRKYSTDLEEVATKLKVLLANMDELNSSQRVLFDEYGNLSDYGVERFWKSLSDYFCRIDRDEHYAIKRYRTSKRSVATQTFTQQKTLNPNAAVFTPKTDIQKSGQPTNQPSPIMKNFHNPNTQPMLNNQKNFYPHQPPPNTSASNLTWNQNAGLNSTTTFGNQNNDSSHVMQQHPQYHHYNYPQNNRYHVNNL